MHSELAVLMDTLLSSIYPIKIFINENKNPPPIIKEYFDSLESVRSIMVPVKEGTAITGEEKLEIKLVDFILVLSFMMEDQQNLN